MKLVAKANPVEPRSWPAVLEMEKQIVVQYKLPHLTMAFLVMVGVSWIAPAAADEIRFQAAAAMRGALESLLPAFERGAGHKVVMTCGNVNQNAAKLLTSEKIDLLMITPAQVVELQKAAKPDVGSLSRKPEPARLSARAIALNDPATGGPSGIYAMQLFQRLGIAEQFQPKLRFTRGRDNASALVAGQADIAISQVAEVLTIPEMDLAGPLPNELQGYTELAATIPRRAEFPGAGVQLRAFLTSPTARAALQASGLRANSVRRSGIFTRP